MDISDITVDWLKGLGFLCLTPSFCPPTQQVRFQNGTVTVCHYKPLNLWHFPDANIPETICRRDVLSRLVEQRMATSLTVAEEFEIRVENATNVISSVNGSPMHRCTYDKDIAVSSQELARRVTVDWIMKRYTGPVELTDRAILHLTEAIPLASDWCFTTSGRGISYRVLRQLEGDHTPFGSPCMFAYFASEIAVVSIQQCIIAHDETEGMAWDCIATWIAERDG